MKRLDKYLSEKYPDQSRSYFEKLIKEGLVLVNGQIFKKRQLVTEADILEVEFALSPDLSIEPENIPLSIVYEDEHLLVINKPAGLVVHPASGNWTGTFVNALLYHCGRQAANDLRPGIVHRLDKDTTGLLVAAKTAASQRLLVEAFASRTVIKEYEAIIFGQIEEQTIEKPIGRSPQDRKKMAIVKNGKLATTDVKPLKLFKEASLIKIILKTGRTHQIRVHMRSIEHPILGDPLYGFEGINRKWGLKRQMLHAKTLSFIHPINGNKLYFESSLPEDMLLLLKKL